MSDESKLSDESKELLRLVKAHTTESLHCVYKRIDDVAKEQVAQRKMHAGSVILSTKLVERIKAHEKRIDKCEKAEAAVTRKAYALSGAQAAVFAILHFFKGGH